MSIILALPAQKLVLNAFTLFTGTTPSNATFNAHIAYITANGEASYTSFLNSVAKDIPVATLASNMLTNLGLTAVFTQAEAVAYLNSNASNLGGAMTAVATATLNYVSNASFAKNAEMLSAQTAWTNTATNALAYSSATTSTSAGSMTATAAGTTFTLTTGSDAFTGGATADTFTSADTTLSVADQINGGEGIDTFTFTDSSNGGGIPAAGFTSVENFYIRNVQTANAGETYDFAAITGEAQVWSDRSTDAVTFDNLAAGTTVGLKGDNGTVLGNVAFQMATATDAISLFIDGGVGKVGTAPTITEVGSNGTATTAVIASTGLANVVGTVDLAATTLTSVTVNAATNLKGDFLSQATDQVGVDGTVTISGAATSVEFTAALDNTIKTINAAGLTAGGAIILAGTGLKSFTGGAGNDSVKTAALTSATIAGGTGTDTLIVGAATDVDTVAERSQYSGFEVINVNAATNLAINNFTGVESIVLSADSAGATGLTAGQAAAVTTKVANTSGATLALATATGTSDVLTITIANATATTAADVGALTANGFETINIVSSSGTQGTETATGANDFGFAAANVVTAINVSGAYDLDLAAANITKAVTITNTQTGTAAFGASGNFVAGSTINGTANGDTFALGTAGSTYNAGAGADAITGTAITLIENSGVFTTINGGDGTDTLTLTAAAMAMVDSNFSRISNIEALTVASAGGAGDISITTGGFFDTAFKTAGVTLTAIVANEDAIALDAQTFSGDLTVVATNASAADAAGEGVSIKTGSGADTVTVTAANWVGAAGATSTILVDTGAGNDIISVTTSTAVTDATTANQKVIDAGTGADKITLAGVNHTTGESYYQLRVAAGDSTISAYDEVTGFDLGDGTNVSDALDFGTYSVTGAVAATAVTGFSAAELTVALTVTTGLAVFGGSSAASLTAAQALAAIDQVITNGKTAIWNNGTDTYVFNADAAGDSVVKLVGVAGTALIAAEATTTGGVAGM